jgi:hypothetical protein
MGLIFLSTLTMFHKLSMSKDMKLKHFTLTFLTFCLAIVTGQNAAQAASLTTIASNLNNARGITFGSDGSLFVAETGLGGNGNCQGSPSTGGQPICAGNTSSVTKIAPDGRQSRIFNGFESLALQPSQQQGAGIQDLKFDSKGSAYLLAGWAGNPGNRDSALNAIATNVKFPPLQSVVAPLLPADKVLNTPSLAKLYKADLKTQTLTPIFDFGKYELLNNPDKGDVVTNPYALAIKDDTAYIADGGGNTIYGVKLDGSEVKAIPVPTQTINNPEYPPISPNLPPGVVPDGGAPAQLELQSVPTGITLGPDGDIYFSEYTGFPYPEGAARVFRIGDDGVPEVVADGFSHVTDLTFDKDGNLLVLQFSDEAEWKGKDLTKLPGSLIQLAPDGTRTTLVAAGEGLESSTGVTIGPDNKIYITKRGVGTLGEVVRVDSTAVPEPTTVLTTLTAAAFGGTSLLKRKRSKKLAEAEIV